MEISNLTTVDAAYHLQFLLIRQVTGKTSCIALRRTPDVANILMQDISTNNNQHLMQWTK